VPSPNCGGRIEPHLIVLHDTADRLRPDDTVSWFATSRSKVSAHLVVGRDGSIVQMVDFDRAAWHAGKSSWRARAVTLRRILDRVAAAVTRTLAAVTALVGAR
jgi:N-acetyl-anhydromuramyl-L-alanine amidase AmpD